ncbi:MAG: SURF1 family protein [Pseudomonadota bacterium]
MSQPIVGKWRRHVFVGIMILFCGVFLTLCYWQVQRLAWKQAVLARFDQIATTAVATQTPLTDTTLLPVAGTLSGTLDLCHVVFLANQVQDDTVGRHLLAPLQTVSGDIFVDFGWIDSGYNKPACGKPVSVKISGIAVQPRWNSYMPAGEVSQDHWVRSDVVAMSDVQGRRLIAPVLFLALNTTPSAILPDGLIAPTFDTLRPRNNHLQYAFFWGAMAAMTALLTAFYMRQPKQDGL